MNHAHTLLAAILVVALGQTTQAQVPAVVPDPGVVAQYDLGITPGEVKRRTPDGYADILIVYSAKWCAPCRAMVPTWKKLRDEGYQIVYIDIDRPEDYIGLYPYATRELIEGAMKNPPSTIPTIRWYNSELDIEVGDPHSGTISQDKIKERLWNPSSPTDSVQGQSQSSSAPVQLWHGLDESPMYRDSSDAVSVRRFGYPSPYRDR